MPGHPSLGCRLTPDARLQLVSFDDYGVFEGREVAVQVRNAAIRPDSRHAHARFTAARAPQKAPVRLLSRLEELRLLTQLSKLGVLSKAEEAGVFSSLEKAGAFSLAEKLLPIGPPPRTARMARARPSAPPRSSDAR